MKVADPSGCFSEETNVGENDIQSTKSKDKKAFITVLDAFRLREKE